MPTIESKSFIPQKIASLLLIGFVLTAPAQHPWQKPLPPRSLKQIHQIMGPGKQSKPSRPLTIVWVWSRHDHAPGFHEYEKVRDLYQPLLEKIPTVKVETAYKFPSAGQWATADLVVFYLHFDRLREDQYTTMKSFVKKGGGIMALHESMIMRPKGERHAECIGLAWDEGNSLWGLMPTPFKITDTGHPIMARLGEDMDLVDEFYWKLTGDREKIHVLATSQAGPPESSRGPTEPAQLDCQAWPLFWTMNLGKGRVFASLPGHNLFTFDDAYFRIILFRAMAWTTHESFDPFKPLVTKGLQLNP